MAHSGDASRQWALRRDSGAVLSPRSCLPGLWTLDLEVPSRSHRHGVPVLYAFSDESSSPISSLFQVTPVPELSLTAVKLSHDGTGAQYLHLAREDGNNLFRCVCTLGSRSGCSAGASAAPAAVQQEWRGGASPPWLLRVRRGPAGRGALTMWLCPQCAVPHHPHRQQRRPPHPGTHGPVRLSEIPLPRPFLQDAEPVAVHIHERLHR